MGPAETERSAMGPAETAVVLAGAMGRPERPGRVAVLVDLLLAAAKVARHEARADQLGAPGVRFGEAAPVVQL
jgi:hypothetical protein